MGGVRGGTILYCTPPNLPLWGGTLENKVHQKPVFVQFEILNFRPNCHPEFVSGSYQNVVNTPNWQDAETSSAFCFRPKWTIKYSKRPSHSAHRSLKLACRSFSKLIFNKLKRTRINLVLFN